MFAMASSIAGEISEFKFISCCERAGGLVQVHGAARRLGRKAGSLPFGACPVCAARQGDNRAFYAFSGRDVARANALGQRGARTAAGERCCWSRAERGSSVPI